MPLTVPMQAGGAKSLPAELKVRGGNPFARFRAEHPGFGQRTPTGFGALPIRTGAMNPLVLNPVVARWAGMSGLGDDTTVIDTSATTDVLSPTPDVTSIPSSTPLPESGDILSGLQSITPAVPDWTGPTVVAPNVSTPMPPNGYSWAQVLNSSGQVIGQILAISQGGSVTQLPNGLKVVQGSPAGAVTQAGTGFANAFGTVLSNPSSVSTLLLFGGLAVLMIAMSGRR